MNIIARFLNIADRSLRGQRPPIPTCANTDSSALTSLAIINEAIFSSLSG
jgi:hypothetical protein